MTVPRETAVFPLPDVPSIPPASTIIQGLRRDMSLGVRAVPYRSVPSKAGGGHVIGRHGSRLLMEVRDARGRKALRYVKEAPHDE